MFNLDYDRDNLIGADDFKSAELSTAFYSTPIGDTKAVNNVLQTYEVSSLASYRSKMAEKKKSQSKKEKEQKAESYIDNLFKTQINRDQDVLIWTDGSASPNPGAAGCAALLTYKGEEFEVSNISLGHSTNNLAELAAVQLGLFLVEKHAGRFREQKVKRVVLLSDSKLVVNLLNGIWNPSQETIRKTVEEIKKKIVQTKQTLFGSLSGRVDFVWVPAHSSVAENERVDKLAKQAASASASFSLASSASGSSSSSSSSTVSHVATSSSSSTFIPSSKNSNNQDSCYSEEE